MSNDANFVRALVEPDIKKAYFYQMQHQMYVTDRKWCDYVIFNQNLNKIHITRVERNKKEIEKIKRGLEVGKKKVKDILEKIK